MIGSDEINTALARLNPQNDAVRAMNENFGPGEALPFMRDVIEGLGINEGALREFAQTQFAYYVSECGDDPDLAAAKVDALMLGFNCGVAAAREDA